MGDADLVEENARLKAQLAELNQKREQERAAYETKVASERNRGQTYAEEIAQRTAELESIKRSVVRMTRQLDEEVSKRDAVQAEAHTLERKLHDLASGSPEAAAAHGAALSAKLRQMSEDELQEGRERGSQVSAKLMRVVDQWMRQRDLQQALLRGACLNDQAFGTLTQALSDCPSLHTLDLSNNLLTMDSCSDVCLLITSAPQLSFISLAENLLSLRCIGYFMTAIMERQNTKKLMPLDLLDLQGNEGTVAAAAAPALEPLVGQIRTALRQEGSKLPGRGAELLAQVMRALWRFLHDTRHPQVKSCAVETIAFHLMDKVTLRKMENALLKILLLGADSNVEDGTRPLTANLALLFQSDEPGVPELVPPPSQAHEPPKPAFAVPARDLASQAGSAKAAARASELQALQRDPFADLKSAFEPPKDKLKTFNLKQIVTRNGTVLMNMLERLLETTEIDARDVETEQTLLEFACNTGNMGLAKLCYRRGAKLMARTRKGDTAFNIVTKSRRYDMMEFLHTYGVSVNSCDGDGRTALHCAAHNNDCDGICRLIGWGADVNQRDKSLQPPIHVACAAGNMKATLLLLEVGADMFLIDEKHFNAPRHAELNSHFALFDKLVSLGEAPQSPHILMRVQSEGQLSTSTSASPGPASPVGAATTKSPLCRSSSLTKLGKSLMMDSRKKPLWLEAEMAPLKEAGKKK